MRAVLNRDSSGSSSPQRSRRPSQPAAPTATDVAAPIFLLLRDTVSNIFWLLRKPLSWALAVYLLLVILASAYHYTRTAVLSALSPLCALPLDLPFCTAQLPQSGPSNFPQLIDLQTSFEGVLENSVGGSYLALDLKNSEMAVRDLNSLVRSSSLTCKHDLSSRLDEFINNAKTTSRQLTKFSSKVGGVVDSLLAMDEYAIKALESVAAIEAGGRAQEGVVGFLMSPFYGHQDLELAARNVYDTFIKASSIMDTSIRRLITEASLTLSSLEQLEGQLVTIEDLARHEHRFVAAQHSEVLSQIWTVLGGNRKKLDNFREHEMLLGNVGVYRKKALAHVVASLILLQNMQSQLEELRERVVAPGLLGEEGEVPLEVHIESIRRGVERLSEGMKRAKGRESEVVMKMLGEHEEAIRSFGAAR